MTKQQINMVGGGFQHDICSCSGSEPIHMEWVKGKHTAPISIHIDSGLKMRVDSSKENYGWLSESKTINGYLYDYCINNSTYLQSQFKYIFTHDKSLAEWLPHFFKLVIGSSKPWVTDIGLHPKNKLVSMIASNKAMCPEHKFRLSMVQKYRPYVDLYGRGFNPIKQKEDGLRDYCFSITIENGNYPNMFSEKLTDCLVTGTVPIYWGIPNIGEFFNMDGIIKLDENFDINNLSFELYESKMDAIKDNFLRGSTLPIVEDYIYEKFIKK